MEQTIGGALSGCIYRRMWVNHITGEKAAVICGKPAIAPFGMCSPVGQHPHMTRGVGQDGWPILQETETLVSEL